MNTKIETYRNVDIFFNTDDERFTCAVADSTNKESKSFSACKKFIDEYINNNENFKPFTVIGIPDKYGYSAVLPKVLTVTGMRKDKRFVAVDEKGTQYQISDYDLDRYMLTNPENEPFIKEYDLLVNEQIKFYEQYAKSKSEILSRLKIKTLKEVKRDLLQGN